MKAKILLGAMVAMTVLPCCEELDDDPDKYLDDGVAIAVPLDDVAVLLSEIQIGNSQVKEVYDAVTSSSYNGYDEEYMMCDLFREPGAGVGDDAVSLIAAQAKAELMKSRGAFTKSDEYSTPLKTLLEERIRARQAGSSALTKADGTALTAEQYLNALTESDIQIYWPFSEDWDGDAYPIITYDPDDGSTSNIGYQVAVNENGESYVTEVVVNEDVAESQPVWVINYNDDSDYTSLDLLRMQDPDWGSGGEIIIKSSSTGTAITNLYGSVSKATDGEDEAEDDGGLKTLLLKDFTMLRHYDSWFGGASEFFVKLGSLEDFTASTEAEMYVYEPAVTDFMIVVKRKYLNVTLPFNAILVSEWTEQLEYAALMITEYDGGTRTSWTCSAVVKINSKSYGFEIEIPINTRDDIVWRGQLSRKWILENNGVTGCFGDVNLTFEIVEY